MTLPVVLALAALVAAAWWFMPAAWRAQLAESRARPQPGSLCSALAEESLAGLVGRVAVEARTTTPPSNVPAASACRWEFFGGSIDGRLFDAGSLRTANPPMDAAAYFESVATGLEYEFKAPPQRVSIGDQAVTAGFEGGGVPQIVVRSGDRVLVLEVRGIDRPQAETIAAALIKAL